MGQLAGTETGTETGAETGAGTEIAGFWAVVPAGGAGTRLWPLSRVSAPKFLHDMTGSGRSLLQSTCDRLTLLAGDRVVVVTGAAQEARVRAQLPRAAAENLLVEPEPRDSMAAIGLAAAVIERRAPDGVIGSFPADHVIGDVPAFHDAVREAAVVAGEGYLVTLGIAPTHPSTAFGYIREGPPLRVAGAPNAFAVRQFVEKPDAATATLYIQSGAYRWNAGMFVVKATVLLDLLQTWHPRLARGLRDIAAAPDRLPEIWPTLTRIAIDHAVAEPGAAVGRVAVIPVSFPWDDVGDFGSLGSLLPEPEQQPGVRVLGDGGGVISRDSTGLVAAGTGRMIALVGLDDVVVIDTPDALLVMRRDRAQDVKAVVDQLNADGRADLT